MSPVCPLLGAKRISARDGCNLSISAYGGAVACKLVKPSVIVWDLEAVPDLGGFAAANNLLAKSAVEVREALGNRFPKHIYHTIVCIGALVAHRESGSWVVHALGAPHDGGAVRRLVQTT
jgi:hypothetical protein